MDLEANYEINRVAGFIRSRNFTRVALQFPDELLKDSVKVVGALRENLRSFGKPCGEGNGDVKDIGLYVMADTTYGSCCVDEVGAAHINADCVIHYGHTCLSQTSTLPALFVFGKASINASDCAEKLCSYALTVVKPVLVLFGLEYAHAIEEIKDALTVESSNISGSISRLDLRYANVTCSAMDPLEKIETLNGRLGVNGSTTANEGCSGAVGKKYNIGGLNWSLLEGHKMEDYLLFWIGSDNPAFSNVVLTFNGCQIVRYDATETHLVADLSQQKRILKHIT